MNQEERNQIPEIAKWAIAVVIPLIGVGVGYGAMVNQVELVTQGQAKITAQLETLRTDNIRFDERLIRYEEQIGRQRVAIELLADVQRHVGRLEGSVRANDTRIVRQWPLIRALQANVEQLRDAYEAAHPGEGRLSLQKPSAQ